MKGRSAERVYNPSNIYHFLYSEETFFNIVAGNQPFIVVSGGSKWWKENKEKVVRGNTIITKVHGKARYSFTATVEGWKEGDAEQVPTTGLNGTPILITIRDVKVKPWLVYFTKKFLEVTPEERQRKKEEVVLKAKIRKAFK